MAITAKFEADFTQFKDAVQSAENTLKTFTGSTQSLGTAIATSLASTEIRRFAGDVRNVANEFIGAFAEEEAAVKKLEVALQAQGTLTPAIQAQYAALAGSLQKTTTFSDDLVTSMQALLVQVGGVMPGQMAAALEASTNLAAGLGISLESATTLVAKAFGQGGEQLGKLKALLGDTVPKGADMAQVLEAINSKFGGQAAAQIETYTGRMAQLNNQMSDVKERVGELLVNGLTPLANAFAAMPEGLQTVTVAVVAIGAALAPLALSAAAMTTVVTSLATAFGVTLAGSLTALLPFLGPVGLVAAGVIAVYVAFKNWSAITGFVKGVYDGIKLWLVDRFTGIVESIKNQVNAVIGVFRGMYEAVVGRSYVPDMVDGIAEQMGRLQSVMVEPVQSAAAQVMGSLSQLPGLSIATPSAGGGGGGMSGGDLSRYGASLKTAFNPGLRMNDVLSPFGAGGGVNINSTVNVSGVFDANSQRQLQEAVSKGLTTAVMQRTKVAAG